MAQVKYGKGYRIFSAAGKNFRTNTVSWQYGNRFLRCSSAWRLVNNELVHGGYVYQSGNSREWEFCMDENYYTEARGIRRDFESWLKEKPIPQ